MQVTPAGNQLKRAINAKGEAEIPHWQQAVEGLHCGGHKS